jgi:hypothetical protein
VVHGQAPRSRSLSFQSAPSLFRIEILIKILVPAIATRTVK